MYLFGSDVFKHNPLLWRDDDGELGKFSYTKRFRLLSKMEHLYGYIMRLYGDLNCVIRN